MQQHTPVNGPFWVGYIPLIQNVLWIIFAAWLIYFFRSEIQHFRTAMSRQLNEGASVKIGVLELGELRNDFKSVQRDLDETNNRIARLFITTMGENIYGNLKKMTTGNFRTYKKSKGLVRELYYLRDLGYIEVPSISDIPESVDQLSLYLLVTNTGREFIKLREEVLGN